MCLWLFIFKVCVCVCGNENDTRSQSPRWWCVSTWRWAGDKTLFKCSSLALWGSPPRCVVIGSYYLNRQRRGVEAHVSSWLWEFDVYVFSLSVDRVTSRGNAVCYFRWSCSTMRRKIVGYSVCRLNPICFFNRIFKTDRRSTLSFDTVDVSARVAIGNVWGVNTSCCIYLHVNFFFFAAQTFLNQSG